MTTKKASYICAFALIPLAILSLFIGVMELGWQAVSISRLPRTLAALMTGGSLAVCGMILQSLVRNRFVEPMTTGIGEGAALGVLATIIVAPSAGILVKMSIAAITALLSSLGFLLLVLRLPRTQPLLVPLVGIIYGGIIGAVMTFFAYQNDLLQYVGVWLTGGFSGVIQGRYELLWIAAIVTVLSYFIADQFAIVGLGNVVSTGLGLNYRQVMFAGLLAISVVSALTIVTVGLIPFVGLVVPNIISERFGDNLRATLPLTAISGAGAVLACDILGRVIRFPYDIPVGVIFGVVGAVVFLWLLYGARRHV